MIRAGLLIALVAFVIIEWGGVKAGIIFLVFLVGCFWADLTEELRKSKR